MGLGVLEDAEFAEAGEEGVVADLADGEVAEGVEVEEVPGEGVDAEGRAVFAGFEEAEGEAEGLPVVVVAFVVEVAFFGEAAEALEAVVAVVDVAFASPGVGVEDEVAVFDDKEEEEAVNEAEELVVEGGGVGGIGGTGEGFAEAGVVGMGEEAVGEGFDGVFDGAGEAFADAGAGVEGFLVVFLHPAFGGVGDAGGKAGGVEEAIEDGEVGEEVVLDHAFEVEFEEREADEAGAVAEEAQEASVGDEAEEVFGEVEVFLEKSVGGHAGSAGLAFFVEAVVAAHDVDGEAFAVGEAVTDGVGFAVEGFGFGGFGAVTEHAEEGDDPEGAGFGNAGGPLAESAEAALVDAPLVFGIGPGGGDLVFDLGSGGQAEVDGTLSGRFFAGDLVEKIGGEDGAFDADGGEEHGKERATRADTGYRIRDNRRCAAGYGIWDMGYGIRDTGESDC